MHWHTHGTIWYESDNRVTRKAASDRQQDVHWPHVHTWHDHSYIAQTPLLAHGLTVKLSPLSARVAKEVGLDEYLHVYVGIATHSGSPEDDSVSL